MERVEDATFGPLDRIGQLTLRLLDIEDSRGQLALYGRPGLTGGDGALRELATRGHGPLHGVAGALDHDDRYARRGAEMEQRAHDLGAVLRLDHVGALDAGPCRHR